MLLNYLQKLHAKSKTFKILDKITDGSLMYRIKS